MADEIMDEGTPLSIVVEVETEDARRKLEAWNKEVTKSATITEKAQKLLEISARASEKVSTSSGRGATARRSDYTKIQNEVARILSSLLASSATPARSIVKGRSTVPTSEEMRATPPSDRGFLDESHELGDADKLLVTADSITKWVGKVKDGVKTVTRSIIDTEGEVSELSKTLTKQKGTQVSAMAGDVMLTTEMDDKTLYRTKEIGEGFKVIRDYTKLANGEIYLLSTKTSELSKNATKAKKSFKDIATAGLGKIADNSLKSVKNLTSGKLIKRLGSIITYRIARAVMSGISNGAKQGFSLLGQDNSQVNEMLTTFETIKTEAQVAFASTLLPMAQVLVSALEPITTELIDIANAVSLANAQKQGEAEYYKLSTDKIKEYSKSLKQANQQLSQLDKFATLSGSKTADLGSYELTTALPESDEKNLKQYSGLVTLLTEELPSAIERFGEKGSETLSSLGKNFRTVVDIAGLLLAVINPTAGALVGFGVAALGTSEQSKNLATAMLMISGALIGVGIAKSFAINPIGGVVFGAIGGILLGQITSLVSSASSVDTNSGASGSSSLSGVGNYSSLYSQSDLYSGIETATSKGYSSSGTTTVRGDVYIDGQKAGRILENSVYGEGKRVGHFK